MVVSTQAPQAHQDPRSSTKIHIQTTSSPMKPNERLHRKNPQRNLQTEHYRNPQHPTPTKTRNQTPSFEPKPKPYETQLPSESLKPPNYAATSSPINPKPPNPKALNPRSPLSFNSTPGGTAAPTPTAGRMPSERRPCHSFSLRAK